MTLDLQAQEKPPSKPEAPRLGGTERDPDKLHVVWDVAAGASSYEVELTWSNGADKVANLTMTEHTFKDLVSNRRYAIRVRALNDAGASDWSASLDISTLPPKPPAPVQQSAQMIDAALPVTLQWKAKTSRREGG